MKNLFINFEIQDLVEMKMRVLFGTRDWTWGLEHSWEALYSQITSQGWDDIFYETWMNEIASNTLWLKVDGCSCSQSLKLPIPPTNFAGSMHVPYSYPPKAPLIPKILQWYYNCKSGFCSICPWTASSYVFSVFIFR